MNKCFIETSVFTASFIFCIGYVYKFYVFLMIEAVVIIICPAKSFSCLLAVPFSLRKTQPGISIDYSLSILSCIDDVV